MRNIESNVRSTIEDCCISDETNKLKKINNDRYKNDVLHIIKRRMHVSNEII